MKKCLLFLLFIFLIPTPVLAGRGCCSSHRGVCGCTKYGKQICCDGQASPTCTCTPPQVYGCTDYKADNYNREANVNDGSCTYTVMGCTDSSANNYNSSATKDDGSCRYDIYGCTDYKADNYNSNANKDDGSCTYTKETSNTGKNYDHNDSVIKNTESETDDTGSVIGGFFVTVLSIAGIVLYKKKKK